MLEKTNRRTFVKAASAGVAVAMTLSSKSSHAAGPNDKLVVGLVGCDESRGQGRHGIVAESAAGFCQPRPSNQSIARWEVPE